MNRVAVRGLRNLIPFRNTSARLLGDLVELATPRRLAADAETTSEAPFIVVLEGTLAAAPLTRRAEGRPGSVLGGATLLAPGDAWISGLFAEAAGVRLRATHPAGALLLEFPHALLERALKASASLARSLAPGSLELVGSPLPSFQAIWVCTEPGLAAPLEALTHLLAASVARQFKEAAAAVVVGPGGDVMLRLWTTGGFLTKSYTRSSPATAELVVRELKAIEERDFYHLFFVYPSDPSTAPAAFDGQTFHRLVYLAGSPPSEIPSTLTQRLEPATLDPSSPSDPYFSSVIPSVLVRRDRGSNSAAWPPAPSLIPSILWRTLGCGGSRKRFEADPVEADFDPCGDLLAPTLVSRLERDLCRLDYDLDEIRRLWAGWPPSSPTAFADVVFSSDADYQRTSFRWARAVTNRQVGLALSGGGAASYRIVPLIRMLHRRKVPIDVLSAVSGGALLGAYYCKSGTMGLDRFVARGRLYQTVILLAVLNSGVVEAAVDSDLGETQIDDLAVRFVPLTTARPEDDPPEASAIVAGTLGEAVRASGAAPGIFAPTDKGRIRYADGATASPVPARILPDFGADLVFACNSVAGPDRRNPFDRSLAGALAYHIGAVARFVDVWVAGAFLLQQVSREASRDADVFVEASPVAAPIIECFRFDQATWLVDRGRLDPRVRKGAAECVKRWREFAGI